jgi:exonuclease V gamma subunit
MKRFTAVILAVFIITGAFQTSFAGISKNDSALNLKKLTDCLVKTQKVDSLEADLITKTTGGQSLDFTMHMKAENIKKGLKSYITLNVAGQKQEFYLSIAGAKATVYMKDPSGKYKATVSDSSKLGDMNVMKSLTSYITIIKKNPNMVKKVDKNKFRLTIPKNKISEFYSKISGKTLTYAFEKMSVEFEVGIDGYIKTVILNVSYKSTNMTMITKYYNYNKKFNIVLPKVS